MYTRLFEELKIQIVKSSLRPGSPRSKSKPPLLSRRDGLGSRPFSNCDGWEAVIPCDALLSTYNLVRQAT